MSSSFPYLNLGIGRLDTPNLVPGRVQDLGHESVRNIETQIAGTKRRNKHAQSQTRSEQFLVIGIDSRVYLPGSSRSQSHQDDEERKADGDSSSVEHLMIYPYCAFSTEATHFIVCRRRIFKRRELVGGFGAGMDDDGKRRRHQHVPEIVVLR